MTFGDYHDLVCGLVAFVTIFAGGVAGLYLHRLLPERHLTAETRDVVRLGIGMISLLASLTLGLLTSSAKTTFDGAEQEMQSYTADIISLDGMLRDYGIEANAPRQMLLEYTDRAFRTTWGDQSGLRLPLDDKDLGKLLNETARTILALVPARDDQRWIRDQALNIATRLIHTRLSLLLDQASAMNPVLLVLMVAWITIIFASFGLNAPRNATVVGAFLVCSLSIGTSIFLILEMSSPLDGMIMISGKPMASALDHLREPDGNELQTSFHSDLSDPIPK
jgi:hypothetical protein